MAKISKDKGSYRASGILHRDNRHDKSVDGSTGPARKKKNTKKWCKGVEGRAHTLEWKESKWSLSFRVRYPKLPIKMEIVCTTCYKILERDRDGWSTKWIGNPPKKKQALMEVAIAKYWNSEIED